MINTLTYNKEQCYFNEYSPHTLHTAWHIMEKTASICTHNWAKVKINLWLTIWLGIKEYSNSNLFCEKNLIDLEMVNDVSLNKSVEKGASKSWFGRTKVMLQVTWEWGLLDLDIFCMEDFTEKGKLDGMGNIISNTSLSQLLTDFSWFSEE